MEWQTQRQNVLVFLLISPFYDVGPEVFQKWRNPRKASQLGQTLSKKLAANDEAEKAGPQVHPRIVILFRSPRG